MKKPSLEMLRNSLMELGMARLGPPNSEVKATIYEITDPKRLERMLEQACAVLGWQEVLDTP